MCGGQVTGWADALPVPPKELPDELQCGARWGRGRPAGGQPRPVVRSVPAVKAGVLR